MKLNLICAHIDQIDCSQSLISFLPILMKSLKDSW